jgi:DNA-binding transcriptional LysR family regulator
MIDRFTSMTVFVRATDLGSLTAAATTLGMSAQMAGKHVRALEDRLGTPLMHRSTRRQSLTDAGRLYYERCRRVLAEIEAAESIIDDLSATPRGRLRITAPVGFGATRLAPVLTALLARHAAIEVELVLTDRYVDPVDEGYDAVLRLGPIAETALAARELAAHEQVVCAAPAYLAARGTPATPEDLAGHACLGFVNASGLPYALWRFTKDGAEHAVRIRSRFQVNDGRVLAAAAAAGHGLILQPEAVLRDHIARGALVPVLTGYRAPGPRDVPDVLGAPTSAPETARADRRPDRGVSRRRRRARHAASDLSDLPARAGRGAVARPRRPRVPTAPRRSILVRAAIPALSRRPAPLTGGGSRPSAHRTVRRQRLAAGLPAKRAPPSSRCGRAGGARRGTRP